MANNPKTNWAVCSECQGRGRKSRGVTKKAKLKYKRSLDQIKTTETSSDPPTPPKGHLHICLICSGSGLTLSSEPTVADKENYPHVAIIGAGIGGVALAVACLHRGIPFTLYERDNSFNDRSQGYGLTLQQASRAIEGLGIFSLDEGIISTRHVVHTTDGKVIGEWGIKKWLKPEENIFSKRTNVHIARQSLRLALLEQLGGEDSIHWAHQLVDIKEGDEMELSFQVDGKTKTTSADLVVGADGIRSAVRKIIIGENTTPLRYLGCIVILGICPLNEIKNVDTTLLNSATVFQTANGNERIYMMPYSSDSIMWQLSFPMPEKEAKKLSEKGPLALKAEAQKRTQWHEPIPQILSATKEAQISGYPVYDREILNSELLKKSGKITLIGDAAHPMSPFKGQGANQALLDALALARGISRGCRPQSQWRESGIRERVLNEFEEEMLVRTAAKVKDSAEAAKFLHSDIALYEGDEPRGRAFRRKNKSE